MPIFEAIIAVGGEPEATRIAGLLTPRLGEETPISWSETSSGWQVSIQAEAADAGELERRVRDALGNDAFASGLTVLPLPEIDWVAHSLEGLAPVRAGRFFVHGKHDRAAVLPNLIGLEIEAGQAFGTGHHGTTAGCLRTIDTLGKRRRFGRVLDLGTGSGVLAIAIAKRWHIPVMASDIDPVAVRIAGENAAHNGVGGLVTTAVSTGFRHAAIAAASPFDLIVANILAGPLVALAPDVARHLAARGTVVLSGLLPKQRARVIAAYRSQHLPLRHASVLDGWLTLVLGR